MGHVVLCFVGQQQEQPPKWRLNIPKSLPHWGGVEKKEQDPSFFSILLGWFLLVDIFLVCVSNQNLDPIITGQQQQWQTHSAIDQHKQINTIKT
jgi:hypothetical protein